MKEPDMSDRPATGAPRKAGAFDLRNLIAALIGFYGIVLVVVGLVADSGRQRARTGDVNANLWAGIVMVLVAAAFLLWSRLRPVVIEPAAAPDEPTADPEHSDDRTVPPPAQPGEVS
jgi:hypothetical protein